MTDTPTPPMTPEQRAGLVDWLRHPCAETPDLDANDMADAADQLEADGVELARLTGMLDDYYPAVDWWILQAKEAYEAQLKAEDALTAERDAAQAEIARLTAALATAREDGMREAANRLQDVLDRRVSKKMTRGNDTVANCITIIRSAITKGAAT